MITVKLLLLYAKRHLIQSNIMVSMLLMAREFAPEAACPGKVDPAVDRSPKSMVGNGTVQTGNDDSLVDPNSPKKLVRCRRVNQSKNADATRLAEPDCAVTVKRVKSETKAEQATKRRGRKPNSSLASAEASDNSRIDSDKDAVELPDRRKSRRKEVDSLHSEYPSIKEAAEPSEHDKVTETQLSMPPVSHNETVNVAPSSPSQSLPNGSRPKRGRRGPKKKRSMNPEANPDSPSLPKGVLLSVQVEDDAPPSANVILKESEVTSESEAKPHGRSGKKALAGNTNEEKIPASRDVVSKKEADATSDSEAKPLRHSDEEVDAVNTNEEEASVKQQEGKKRRGKTISKKDVTEESGNKASGMPHSDKDLSENLVGSKIKIWWPKGQIFYEGVIESFDPVKKKHKILYVDGDKEILTLRKERWEFVGGGTALYGGQAPDLLSPDASSEMHRKKKPKTNSDSSTKQAKADASSKSKSNVEATKSCGKSRDDVKLGSKSKDDTPKTVGRSKDDSGCKSNDDTRKTGSKLKDDADTPTAKSKDDTPKTITKSKGETGRGGGKSNGIAKGKSGSSKVSESEDIVNGKLSDSAKPQETKAKTGKKRRRRGVND